MKITKNGFIDLGNNLQINVDLVAEYDEQKVILKNGETYYYGEFHKLGHDTYNENCYDSNKGDVAYFKKVGKK